MRRLFSFPNPVNETSARVVAGGAVLQAVLFLGLRNGWLLVPLTYGFLARVLSGPTLSPLGQLATRLVTPHLPGPHHIVAGPPKRFAQGIGTVFALGASVAWLTGAHTVAFVLIGALSVAASLEALFAFCIGCKLFAVLMRAGLVPQTVCIECANLSLRATTSV